MKIYNKYLSDFKSMYLANMTLGLILQSCVGSIAAMFILTNNDFHLSSYLQLTLCVIVSMAYNASALAQLSYKVTFNLLLLSLSVNILLIIFNVIMM